MSNWFAFRAYNSQTLYGFGTETEADRYADHLNKGKEINLFAAHELTDADAAERKLEDNTEAFNLDDTLRELSYQDDE